MTLLTAIQSGSDFSRVSAELPKTKNKIIARATFSVQTQLVRCLLAALRREVAKNIYRFGVVQIIGALIFVAFGTAFAGDFDGSKPLICATVDAMDCVPGKKCTEGQPRDMGAPTFMRIDFANKTIGGPKRTTSIVSMDTSENQVLMQGNEQGYGWTFALDQQEGEFSATLVNRDGVFVLFGSCTTL